MSDTHKHTRTHTHIHARTHAHAHAHDEESLPRARSGFFVGFLLLYTKNSWIVTAEFQQQMYSPGAIGVLADTRDESGCASIIRLFSSGRSCTLQYEISGFQQKERKKNKKKDNNANNNKGTSHEQRNYPDPRVPGGGGWRWLGVGVVSRAHC